MTAATGRTIDMGTAYTLKKPNYIAALTEVGRGTPMGELLRRYWHPVGLPRDAGATPQPVRVLGEDLILFRDGQGRPGLVHRALLPPRHHALLRPGRGARHPLLLPRLAVRRRRPLPRPAVRARAAASIASASASPGIRSRSATAWSSPTWARRRRSRCCRATSASRRSDEGEIDRGRRHQHRRRRRRRSSPATGCSTGRTWSTPSTCRSCTASFSGTQFVPQMGIMPKVRVGVRPSAACKRLAAQARRRPASCTASPRRRCRRCAWCRTRASAVRPGRVASAGCCRSTTRTSASTSPGGCKREGRARPDALEDERQVLVGADARRSTSEFPGDYEAQIGQGPITLHSEEHLATSDQGVVMVAPHAGSASSMPSPTASDPAGVSFDPERAAGACSRPATTSSTRRSKRRRALNADAASNPSPFSGGWSAKPSGW